MSHFKVHSKDTAPEAAKETLGKVEHRMGFVPNVVGVMAQAPTLAQGYATLSGLFQQSSLSAVEQQVAILTVSYENDCHYCMAAHSTSAERAKVPPEVIEALREGQPLPDEKLEALRGFTAKMVEKRGWAAEADLERFYEAGYTQANVLEVILCIGMKTLSNYTNHVADTPLDEVFAPKEWKKAG